jgi:hypothetical protein
MVGALQQHRARMADALSGLDALRRTAGGETSGTLCHLEDLLRERDDALQPLVARLETSVRVRSEP